MNFIVENWQTIVGVIAFIAVGVAVAFLYRKNQINAESIDMLIEYLDTIDDGDGIVPLLAGYAKKAVTAVEQMVKIGLLVKENDARKDKAMQIVEELALADGIELSEDDKIAADYLIESEVFEMRKA